MIAEEFFVEGLDKVLGSRIPDQFPGRRSDEHRFDGPGGTLVHAAVCDAIAKYVRSSYVANDGGVFSQSRFTDSLEAWARAETLSLLGTSGGVTVFGASMTTLTALFVRAVADHLAPGDEVVCTELDHEANRSAWEALERSEIVVRIAEMTAEGMLPTEAVTDLIGPRTRWVAVTAASNVTGVMPDVTAITRAAHDAGARVFVDAMQALAHARIDVDTIGCDALVTAAYKWYGPHEGVLWISDRVAPDELSLAEQVPSASGKGGENLSLGTKNHEGMVGLAIAARVLRSWPREEIADGERRLFTRLAEGLREIPKARIITDPDVARVPVLAFEVHGEEPTTTAARLARRGVAVWDGSFYASSVLRRLSPERPTAVRAGIAAYTTERDVDALLSVLNQLTDHGKAAAG